MSTADVGLSPDPKNPLNDVSTMNKTMEYMAFELPVVAFDLRETRVVGRRRRGLRHAQRRFSEYAEAIVALMDDEPRRTQLGQLGRARVEKELAWTHQRQRLPRRLPAPDAAAQDRATGRGLRCAGSPGATSRPTARSSSTS